MNQDIFNKVEEIFFKKMSIKTNWGYKQLKKIWMEAKNEAILENDSSKINDQLKIKY